MAVDIKVGETWGKPHGERVEVLDVDAETVHHRTVAPCWPIDERMTRRVIFEQIYTEKH